MLSEHPAISRTICITGGAGFLGSHLSRLLVAEGSEVFCLDNFHTGRKANLVPLIASGRLTIVEHDVVRPLPAGLPRFDEIYNLACPASPIHYQHDPVHTLQTCAMGTMHVLERAERDGARLFHASTSEVYGDPEIHPQDEGYFGNVNPLGARSCYDEGKRFAETLLRDFSIQRRLTVRMARIFNTYGPGMQPDDGRVVSNFIIQAITGNDITINGLGLQTRSFCYVDDLIDGILKLMRSDAAIEGAVNLGNPDEIQVRKLAEMVIGLTGTSSRIIYRPMPQDDPRRRRPDIVKARTVLDWSPQVPLEQGLAATIDYFCDALRLGTLKMPAPKRRRAHG